MNIFSKQTFGYVPDAFDPRDVWADEVLAGDETPLPPKYTIEGLDYRQQFALPFCVSFATVTMVRYHLKKLGVDSPRSEPHLFFHAGGGPGGSSFRPNLDIARGEGLVPYDHYPMPTGNYGADPVFIRKLMEEVLTIPFTETVSIGGYARILTRPDTLKRAIMQHGPLLIGVNATVNSYYTGKGKREKMTDNHAVLLVGWDETSWIIFDSLAWVKKDAGYGKLDRSYTFNSAYAVTELPENWKELRDAVRTEPFQNVLNHYGHRRNYEAEVAFAAKMLAEFKRFNNQSVLEAAGRFWPVLINAGVYGGYSLTYTKFGMWQPGDLINFVYHWRRTGEYLFDLDSPRS